ncbi:MAG: flagellin, partial [Selenomonas sp.]|nr:flagellin [Selenomonas sp.]
VMTNFTKNNVLTQAAQLMLAQSNQDSSRVLSLLQ